MSHLLCRRCRGRVERSWRFLSVPSRGLRYRSGAHSLLFGRKLLSVASSDVGPTGVAPSGIGLTGVAPSGIGPTGVAPSGVGPTGVAPSGVGPTGVAPSGIGLTGVAPTGIGLTGIADFTGVAPSNIGPTGVAPSGIEPSGVGVVLGRNGARRQQYRCGVARRPAHCWDGRVARLCLTERECRGVEVVYTYMYLSIDR